MILAANSPPHTERAATRSTAIRLIKECTRFRGHLALIVVSLAALGFAQLELTWIAKLWMDGPLKSGDQRQMAELVRHAIEIAVVLVLGLFASRYLLQSLNQCLVQDLRDRAQAHMLEVELSTVRRFQVGELMSGLFIDAGSLSQFVREILRRGIGETMVLVGALVILFRLDWRLAAIMAIAGPLVALVLAYCGGAYGAAVIARKRRWAALAPRSSSSCQGLRPSKPSKVRKWSVSASPRTTPTIANK